MKVSNPAPISALTLPLANRQPNRIAALAGVASALLHAGLWHALQAAATHPSTEVPHRIEVTLMNEPPKPNPANLATQPMLAVAAESDPVRPVAIPLPVSGPPPLKPLLKPLQKRLKTPEKTVPRVKRIKLLNSSQTKEQTNDANPGGSGGGYGVASPTGRGVPGSIGFGGGVGGGTGGGWGAGNQTGTGSGTGTNSDSFSEADFRTNYAINPKPKYPEVARNRGWQGTVLLKVKVTAEGRSELVTIYKSSGHELLDESAVAAVEKWRFIPAQKGGAAVASTVIVPIAFQLD